MQEQFVTYEIALKLKELGFDEPCFTYWFTIKGKNPQISERDIHFNGYKNYPDSNTIAPLRQQVIDWFDKKYNYSIIIPKERYRNLIYYWYYITAPNEDAYSDLTDWQNRYGDLMEECHQDIPGNYLNEEKFNKLIFERKFAFHTKQEAQEQAILKAIELCKK